MSLRGIFDGGGLRKQNGHYQSSDSGSGGGNSGKIIAQGLYFHRYKTTIDGERHDTLEYPFPKNVLFKHTFNIKARKTKSFSFGIKSNKGSITFSEGYPYIPGWWQCIPDVYVGLSADDFEFRTYNEGTHDEYTIVFKMKAAWSRSSSEFIPWRTFDGVYTYKSEDCLHDGDKAYLWSLKQPVVYNANDSTLKKQADKYTGIYMTCKHRQAGAQITASNTERFLKSAMNYLHSELGDMEGPINCHSFHTYYMAGANQEAQIKFTLHSLKGAECYVAGISLESADSNTATIRYGGAGGIAILPAYRDVPIMQSKWYARVFKA